MKCVSLHNIVLVLGYTSVIRGGLNEMWIYTPNDGNNDAWDLNAYQYYTRLSDYDLYPRNKMEFRFKFAPGSLYCGHVMVLLSTAADMQTDVFYELFISIYSNVRRKWRGQVTDYSQSTVDPANCNDFRGFNVSWTNDGKITVIQDTGKVLIDYTDNFPMTILSVGIKTGYGDNGIWAIQHYGIFTGSFCSKQNSFANITLLWNGFTSSCVVCASKCNWDDECLGVNFNKDTNECRLLRTGQVMVTQPAVGWLLSGKCLNQRKMCTSCVRDM